MAFAIACLGIATSARGQDAEATARAAMLRASVILKIAPYVKVEPPPENPPTAYRIAVVGTDATATAIAAHLPGKKVDAATVSVRTIEENDAVTAKDAEHYDLLYIAASVDSAQLKRIVNAHTKCRVVIVCERPGFANSGGGVQMFVQDNGVRFEVNVEALKEKGLRASAQLLKLSRKGPE